MYISMMILWFYFVFSYNVLLLILLFIRSNYFYWKLKHFLENIKTELVFKQLLVPLLLRMIKKNHQQKNTLYFGFTGNSYDGNSAWFAAAVY